MSKKWYTIIQILIVIVALAGSVYAAFTPANSMMNWYNTDDAFYYYKVAQNVLTGHGFTFDGINLTNGFHPLWMVVCLGVFWLSSVNLLLPLRVLIIVSGLFNAATALFLFRLLHKFIHPMAAMVGAFIWALTPAIYGVTTVHGMESAISAFFIVLLLYLAADTLARSDEGSMTFGRMLLIGLVGALTILARLDNLFIVAFVGLFLLFRIKRISAKVLYDMAVLLLAVFVSWFSRVGLTKVEINIGSINLMLAIAIVVNPIVYYFFGMYEGFNQKGILSKILCQLGAAATNLVLMYGIARLLYRAGLMGMFSKSIIILYGVIAFLFVLCLRLAQKRPDSSAVVRPIAQFFGWIKSDWKQILLGGVGYALPIGVIMGTYMLLNKLFFGSPTPTSGQIKTWWTTLPNTVYSHPVSLLSTLGLSSNSGYGPWSLLTSKISDLSSFLLDLINVNSDVVSTLVFVILLLVFILLIMAILKAQNGRLGIVLTNLMAPALFVGCLAQVAYYFIVGYTGSRNWYWVGEMLAIVLLVSVVLDGFFSWLDKNSGKIKWSPILGAALAAMIAITHVNYIVNLLPMQVAPGSEAAYLQETRDVEFYTAENSKIGMTGGGMVAYFIENRTIVNLDGLINSAEYFKAMKAGKAQAFLDKLPLNYVYGNEYVVEESDPYGQMLKNRLVEIGVIHGFDNFTLYHYIVQ